MFLRESTRAARRVNEVRSLRYIGAEPSQRRTRTAGTGFNFQRVPGPTKRTSDSRPFVVYQHGRYTPIGGEGGLVQGWTFHDDSTDGPDGTGRKPTLRVT